MFNFIFFVAAALAGLAFYSINFPYQPKVETMSAQYAYAEHATLSPQQRVAECVATAALMYQISEEVMMGIMAIEGGRAGQSVGPNINGTYDLGPMQINSLWIPKLAQIWGTTPLISYNAVRDNDCINVYVGAWILKQKIVETGSLYSGVAAYHSATAGVGEPYADKVFAAIEKRRR